eukprot:1534783-Pleurochrysis_carterae.AAC.1
MAVILAAISVDVLGTEVSCCVRVSQRCVEASRVVARRLIRAVQCGWLLICYKLLHVLVALCLGALCEG